MTINKQSASYKIAHTMYLSLGGDPEKEFTSVEEIYQDIDQLLGESGDRVTVEPLKVELITNGTTVFDDANITGYKPVEVSVNVDVGTAYEDGYNTGVADQKSKLESISITENGTYNREDGYNEVKVNVNGKLEVPFEEIGYPSELKNELNNELNNKPLSGLEYSKKCYNENKTYYNGDNKLVYAPLVNTSNIKNMSYMFQDCSSLTTVPLFNTGSVTDMKRMFFGCNLLTSIPQLDTGSVTTMSYMFSDCTNLTSIPQLDTGKVTDIGLFKYSGNDSIVNLGGFVNLGMQKSVNKTNTNYFLGASSKLTYESVMNVINNLYDRASAGYSVLTLKFNSKTLALLSEDDIAIATNKGWTLS